MIHRIKTDVATAPVLFLVFFNLCSLSFTIRGAQPFGVSGPHWRKKSCLEPHIKYIEARNHTHTHTRTHKIL